jgi:predicted ester cyclase
MSCEENKDAVRRYYEGRPNWKKTGVIDDLIDPSFVFHEPTAGEVRGPKGLEEEVSLYTTAFPDLTLAVDDLFCEGDKVVGRLTYRGTHTGALQGLAPTGKRVHVASISICHMAEGKIVEEWEIFDALGLLQQVGAVSHEPMQYHTPHAMLSPGR